MNDQNSMTIAELVAQYQQVNQLLSQKFPLSDPETRKYAKMTKIMEELGELANVVLHQSNLQREEKKLADIDDELIKELADVLAATMIFGVEMKIDLEAALKENLQTSMGRLEK